MPLRDSTPEQLRTWMLEHTDKCRTCRWALRRFTRHEVDIEVAAELMCAEGRAIFRQYAKKVVAPNRDAAGAAQVLGR